MQPVERAHWRRRDAQLRSLLDLDGAARDAWLADYARVDATEADHLRRLLRQAETAGPLDRIRAQSAYRDALHEVSGIDVGSTLGEWTIERRLGIGGMAEVFLARRERGAITQRAALKVVATSVATADLHARFLGEQRMLARLSDARIARYYDSGVTGDGRPWMAMEFVDGTPIDRHCREKHLDVAQRLALFRSVAAAVAHAHRHLIVHRDIKPSNVLVDRSGQVKLLDFGIAKSLDDDAVDATRTGARPLTPHYASPEQVRGEPISTTSDVFQLGLLLFELLVEQRPYARFESDSFALERALRELDPPRPSDALAARARDADDARALLERAHLVRGDLDRIVLMALRKDPAQRYSSVERLDEDVASLLAGEPIRARGDSWAYRSSRWIARHRFVAGAVVAACVVAIVAAALLFAQNRVVREQRDNARVEAAKAAAIKNFLVDLIDQADPSRAQGESLSLATVLARGAERIDTAFDAQPEVRAELLLTLAAVYRSLGNTAQARRLIVQAIALHSAPPRDAIALSIATSALAGIERDESHLDAAQAAARDALALAGDSPRARALAASELGIALLMRDETYADAGDALRAAIAAHRRAPTPDHTAIAILEGNLAIIAFREGDLAKAERGYRTAIDTLAPKLGDKHPEVTAALFNLARLFEQQQRWDDAEAILERVVAAETHVLGADHAEVAVDKTRLAYVRLERGDAEHARQGFADALATLRTKLPAGHKRIAENLLGFAEAALALGDVGGAERMIDECLANLRSHFSATDWRVAEARRVQARVWLRQSRRSDAAHQLHEIGPTLLAQPEPYPTRYRAALVEL